MVLHGFHPACNHAGETPALRLPEKRRREWNKEGIEFRNRDLDYEISGL